MSITAKKTIATSAVLLLGASVMALSVPAINLSFSMDQAAVTSAMELESYASVESMVASDTKFEEISGRLFLDNEDYKNAPQVPVVEKKFADEAQWFPYQILPAYQSAMTKAQELDKEAQRRYEEKIESKAASLLNARAVCALVEKHTPEEIGPAARNGETPLYKPNVKLNLPVYLDYCGVSDEYRSAISTAKRFAKSPLDFREEFKLDRREYKA